MFSTRRSNCLLHTNNWRSRPAAAAPARHAGGCIGSSSWWLFAPHRTLNRVTYWRAVGGRSSGTNVHDPRRPRTFSVLAPGSPSTREAIAGSQTRGDDRNRRHRPRCRPEMLPRSTSTEAWQSVYYYSFCLHPDQVLVSKTPTHRNCQWSNSIRCRAPKVWFGIAFS